MKTIVATLILVTAGMMSVFAAPIEKAVREVPSNLMLTNQPVPKSAFAIPAKPVDGRDPFYPASDRLFGLKIAPKATAAPVNTAIVFNGISGSKDRPFAMINGHTFAEGEEAPVNTAGGRVRVLLVAIKDDRAVVEIAGERRELTFQGR